MTRPLRDVSAGRQAPKSMSFRCASKTSHFWIETLRVPGVFILRHKTPKMASLKLNRAKWSNRHKATLEEAFSFADKGLCGRTGKA
jgi:hypothetical protein